MTQKSLWACMAPKKDGTPCRSTTGAGIIRARSKNRWLCATHRGMAYDLPGFFGYIKTGGFLGPPDPEPIWSDVLLTDNEPEKPPERNNEQGTTTKTLDD